MYNNHPVGTATFTIKASKGAIVNPYNFYSTSYSTNFGIEGFNPRKTRHLGTGYVANLRPAVYYAKSLDNFDNQPMLKELSDNYVTSNQKQFRPYHDSNGKDKLPSRIIEAGSGFTRPAPVTIPTINNVYQTREQEIVQDEKHKPCLHKLQLKRVPPLDQGSLGLITHNKVDFTKPDLGWVPDHEKDIGNLEATGHVSNISKLDPIQHLPGEAFREGRYCARPTGHTMNQQTFHNFEWNKGKEANKGISVGSNRDDGYTINQRPKPRYVSFYDKEMLTRLDQVQSIEAAETKKKDPAEYVNLKEGPEMKTLTHAWHHKKDFQYKTEMGDSVGKQKEPSGFSLNHLPYNESRTAKDNFLTNYEMKYLQIPRRDQYVNRGDTDKKPDGFTKNTSTHKFGDGKSFRESQFEERIPFVARRIKLEHPCYTEMFKNYKWSS